MNDFRIRFIKHRWSHHSPHSGYSRLAEYGAERHQGEVILVDKPVSPKIVRERMIWKLAAGTPGYDRRSLAAELKVMWHVLREPGYIYHFLYGEMTYHHISHFNNVRHNRIVATFHRPPARLRHNFGKVSHLRKLSAAICVGSNQREFFTDLIDEDRVFFVPLGVDTEYFTPPASFASRDPDLCLLVGSNFRDFPTFRGLVELVAYIRPQTKFVAVASPKTHGLIGTHPNLELRSGVPEDEFRELYRSASLMIMPLNEATANNAILESMACGLPMVVSDVGAITDYVSPKGAAIIPPFAARQMTDTVLDLLDDDSERERMSKAAREQALKFAWPCVLDRLDEIYAAIA